MSTSASVKVGMMQEALFISWTVPSESRVLNLARRENMQDKRGRRVTCRSPSCQARSMAQSC